MITVHHLDNSRSQRVLWLLGVARCGRADHGALRRRAADARSLFARLRALHRVAPLPGGLGRRRAEHGAVLIGAALTAADVQLTFTLQTARRSKLLEKRPDSLAYIARMEARPAYQRAIEKGGPFTLDISARGNDTR